MRVVIAGGGQVATLIARRLGREGNEVVVVEEDAERCAQLQEQLDAQIVQGNAARVATLRRTGPGERTTHCVASQTFNISSFQEFKSSTRLDLEILRRFLHFNISRIEVFQDSTFQDLEILVNISRFQHFKNSRFQG